MFNLPGQLAIKTIHGRNGAFNVGRLETPLGEFYVKDAELEQYDQGMYEGDFSITAIRAYPYFAAGRLVVELRAHIAGLNIASADILTKEEASKLTPHDVDPIDEEGQRPVAPLSTPAAAPEPPQTPVQLDAGPKSEADSVTPPPAAVAVEADDEDQQIFGSLCPLGSVVKLDPTVDRSLFRRQHARLRQLGYRFSVQSQDWHQQAA